MKARESHARGRSSRIPCTPSTPNYERPISGDGTGTEGTLSEQAGIVAGRLTQFADALDVGPAAAVDAIDAAGVELTGDPRSPTDTAQQKGRETHERPAAPELRCLAMSRAAFARVLVEVQNSA